VKRRIALTTAAVVGLVVAGGTAVATGSASAASSGCSVSYTIVNQWPGGLQGGVTLTNLGSALSYWTLAFDFPDAGQKVTQGWNATWTQSGTHVTAANLSWNSAVPTNGSVSIGFTGSWTGANPVPASFSVNGVACTGGVATSTASPTVSASASTSTSASASASASPSPSASSSGGSGYNGPAPALHVSGNHLATAAGTTYRLLGVDRSSGEYACVQGKGMWDGGPVDQASVDAMKAWNIHAVRIPLNEECWLGLNGTPSGATYQQNVASYVNLLVSNGINPILDLHWTYGQYTGPGTACSDAHATCQKPMPDAQYTPTFWTQVATAFKGNNAVVFDLFNEPYPDAPASYDPTASWTCWRDGGSCTGISYQVAGMQSLVNAVRATGAANVVMLGGISWSNDLSHWLQYEPTDPTGNLIASWHSYNFNSCSNTSCWDTQVAPVAAQVPIDTGEIGQNSCAHDYIDTLMAWADSHGIGYQAWTWDPWGCSGGSVLIQDWSGTPTVTYGQGLQAHLLTQTP